MSAVKIAIKMETDAIEFYKKVAEKTSHPFGKKMFLSFVEDEKRHLSMLNDIFKGLDVDIKEGNPVKDIQTIFENLKDEMMQRIAATSDETEALKVAMDMEKEGYDFYRKSASQTENPKEKALFERLAIEEDQHYNILSNTYVFLDDTNNWFMWEEKGIVDGGTPWA